MPAHALLVHAIVVLAPLTAVLEILCGFWPAARRNLVWLVLALAGTTTVLTPLTTDAGEWLKDQQGHVTPILEEHADRRQSRSDADRQDHPREPDLRDDAFDRDRDAGIDAMAED